MPSIINATTTAGVAVSGDNSGALALQTNNGTTAVTIDTSQNVGVGTASPTARLHVTSSNGQIIAQATSGNPSLLLRPATNNRNWEVFASSGDGSFGVYDGTATSTRLSINTSGYVTTPANPAFLAVRAGTSQTGIATSTNLIYNSTVINVGSGYNSSTGTFTAPVGGTYIFTVVALFGNLTIGQKLDASLVTSNREYYSAPGRLAVASGSTTWSGDYIALATYTVADMDAGDTALYRATAVDSGTVSMLSNDAWSRFSGALIG